MKYTTSLLAALLLMLSAPAAFGQKKDKIDLIELDGRTGAGYRNLLHPAVPLMAIAPDSRAAAMGDVGAASTPDVNSQHWNVAKYAQIEKKGGISVSYIPWLRKLTNEINLAYLVGYYRIDKQQTVSASLRYFSMGHMVFTNEQGVRMQTHTPNEFAVDAGYSRLFTTNFSGGVAFRFIRSDLTGGFSQQSAAGRASAGTSYAADVSVYYNDKFKLGKQPATYAVGASITNIGSKLTYNDVHSNFIPITLRVGGRLSVDLDPQNSITGMLDASKLLIPTPPLYNSNREIVRGKNPDVGVVTGIFQSFYDAPNGAKEEFAEIYWGVGVEYWFRKLFALRTGYFYESEMKGGRQYFTLGAGVGYNIFSLDAAYLVPTKGFNSPMANTMRFSLMVNFDAPQKKRGKGKRA